MNVLVFAYHFLVAIFLFIYTTIAGIVMRIMTAKYTSKSVNNQTELIEDSDNDNDQLIVENIAQLDSKLVPIETVLIEDSDNGNDQLIAESIIQLDSRLVPIDLNQTANKKIEDEIINENDEAFNYIFSNCQLNNKFVETVIILNLI